MKAVVHSEYGPPDVLRVAEHDKPVPKANKVLVKVRAASVNPLDWHFVRGEPSFLRLMGGTGARIPGVDFAGQIEAVGAKVTQLRVGDEVFGTGRGSFAEYMCANENKVAPKPAALSYEQAAAIPVAACTALVALRDHGRLQPGQSVLIVGVAGGVGTFAVQIAKALGAHVSGVCSTRNVDLVRSIGADRVIDYTVKDFASSGRRYDLVVHVAGHYSMTSLRGLLTPDGALMLVGGGVGRDMGAGTLGMLGSFAFLAARGVFSRLLRQRIRLVLGQVGTPNLVFLAQLAAAGKLTPVIDRSYPLADAAEAIRYLEEGHARGKVIVTV